MVEARRLHRWHPASGGIAFLAMTATLCLASACQPPEALESEIGVPRGLETRVVESTVYGQCQELGSSKGELRPVECGGHPAPAESRELLLLSEPGRDAAPGERAVAAAAAVALSADPRTLERSIASVAPAAGAEPADATGLIALGALQHAQARATGDPAFLVDALENTYLALREHPESRAALFNRAVIEGDFGLCRQARKSWRAYLAADRSSEWAEEGRIRYRALPCASRPDLAPAPSASDPELGFVRALESLLPSWADAHANDAEEADKLATEMERLGHRLVGESPDRTVKELARELLASPDDAYVYAVRCYTRGYQRFRARNYRASEQLLLMARAPLEARRSVLLPWCDIWLAGVEIYTGRLQDAHARLDRIGGLASFPLLAGRVLWTHGLADLRAGALERAYDRFARAETELARGGFGAAVAAVRTLKAEALDDLGLLRGSWRDRILALRALNGPQPPFPYHNGLVTGARNAAALGAPEVAERMIQEALAVASEQRDHHAAAEALIRRGDLLLDRNERTEAAGTFARALDQSLIIVEPAVRDRLAANARLGAWMSRRPASERDPSGLLEIADFFAANGPPWRQLDALRAYSQAARERGESSAALRALKEAIGVIRQVRDSIEQETLGGQYWEAAQRIFDEAIREALRSEDALGALAFLEEGRRLRDPSNDLPLPTSCEPPGPVALSSEEADASAVMLAFGVLGDDLVWWRLDRNRCYFGTVQEGAAKPEVDALMAQRAAGSVARDLLESLYRALLLEPLRGVEPDRDLVVVPDRHLLQVPFAALRNPETGRYLAEERAVSLQPGLGEAMLSASADGTMLSRDRWRAVVVGNPAHDRRALSWLPPLPGSAVEARRIAALYGADADLSIGAEATASRVRDELPGAQVLHLAVHATAGPGGGSDLLVLAAEPQGQASGLTHVAELFSPGPVSLELVVLSACSTLESKPSRSGGLVGIGRHFMTRGVPAVVGTLWPVSDALMTDLMVAFHQGVLQGWTASEALRRAQLLELERDPDRSCCDWAAVELIGALPGISPSSPTERSQ